MKELDPNSKQETVSRNSDLYLFDSLDSRSSAIQKVPQKNGYKSLYLETKLESIVQMKKMLNYQNKIAILKQNREFEQKLAQDQKEHEIWKLA